MIAHKSTAWCHCVSLRDNNSLHCSGIWGPKSDSRNSAAAAAAAAACGHKQCTVVSLIVNEQGGVVCGPGGGSSWPQRRAAGVSYLPLTACWIRRRGCATRLLLPQNRTDRFRKTKITRERQSHEKKTIFLNAIQV